MISTRKGDYPISNSPITNIIHLAYVDRSGLGRSWFTLGVFTGCQTCQSIFRFVGLRQGDAVLDPLGHVTIGVVLVGITRYFAGHACHCVRLVFAIGVLIGPAGFLGGPGIIYAPIE